MMTHMGMCFCSRHIFGYGYTEIPLPTLTSQVFFGHVANTFPLLFSPQFVSKETQKLQMWKTMAVATLLGSHGGLYTGVFAPDGEHVLRLRLDLPLQKDLTGETTRQRLKPITG